MGTPSRRAPHLHQDQQSHRYIHQMLDFTVPPHLLRRAAWPPVPAIPELTTAAAAPLPEKPVLTAHDVVMATLFPNGVFSYTAGSSHAPPPPVASGSFFQEVIPPGGVPTNYAIHEAPDFDPNVFFADVPDGEQDELVLLSLTSTLLDIDNSLTRLRR